MSDLKIVQCRWPQIQAFNNGNSGQWSSTLVTQTVVRIASSANWKNFDAFFSAFKQTINSSTDLDEPKLEVKELIDQIFKENNIAPLKQPPEQPSAKAAPEEPTSPPEGTAKKKTKTSYTRELSMQSNEALFIKTLIEQRCPSAKLIRVQRVENEPLERKYTNFRDNELVHNCGGDVNEMLLFHGTKGQAAEDVLKHQNGLDPRFSNGGFYGPGIYLAENPSYVINGPYAHRISGSGGSRVQLLVVKAALGSQQEMGDRITAKTMAMRMPEVRVEGPPRLLYDSVRGGPHRPFVSRGGCDESIMHVVYESRQMYPAYVIEVEKDSDLDFDFDN